MGASTSQDPRGRWTCAGVGERYATERWSRAAHRERDPALVRALLASRLTQGARVLDVPCGTGRLQAALAELGHVTGVDVSREMLAQARTVAAGRLARADVERLPFADDAFEAVVCCRLLHHLRTRAELTRATRELVRVSSTWVAGSFWNTASLETLRRRLPFARRSRNRVAHPPALLASILAEVGAEVVAWKHSLRFVSQQSWFLARKRRGSDGA
jgi:ubiquinone/menaquinone biosynthesis C-methylase UbiE